MRDFRETLERLLGDFLETFGRPLRDRGRDRDRDRRVTWTAFAILAMFFPSNTLIYGISRDGSKNFNICTCEHMILGQLTMGARQTKNVPLGEDMQ